MLEKESEQVHICEHLPGHKQPGLPLWNCFFLPGCSFFCWPLFILLFKHCSSPRFTTKPYFKIIPSQSPKLLSLIMLTTPKSESPDQTFKSLKSLQLACLPSSLSSTSSSGKLNSPFSCPFSFPPKNLCPVCFLFLVLSK